MNINLNGDKLFNVNEPLEPGILIGTGLEFESIEEVPDTLRYPGKLIYNKTFDMFYRIGTDGVFAQTLTSESVITYYSNKLEALAKQIVRLHDPDLICEGYASPSLGTPSTLVANSAWLCATSGTIFGISAQSGQIIICDGTDFYVENMTTNPGALKLVAFSTTIDFSRNNYSTHIEQTENLFFVSDNLSNLFNVVYRKVSVNTLLSLTLDTEFVSFRNDITDGGDGIYDMWFVSLPGGSVGYSFVKTGEYSIIPQITIPFLTDLTARYWAQTIVADEITSKVTEFVNEYNTALNFVTTIDLKRATVDLLHNRIVYTAGVTVVDNASPEKTFSTGVNWSAVFLVEPNGDVQGSKNIPLISKGSGASVIKLFYVYSNATQGYINNALFTVNTVINAKAPIGVHIFILTQDETDLKYYLDGNLIYTGVSSGIALAATNILSHYAQAAATSGYIRNIYDVLMYNKTLTTDDIATIATFFSQQHEDYIPNTGPVISNLQYTNLTNLESKAIGSEITFTYDTDSGTVAEIYVYFMTGGSTRRMLKKAETLNSIIIPTGITQIAGYFFSIVAVDSNGRSGADFIQNNSLTFTITA